MKFKFIWPTFHIRTKLLERYGVAFTVIISDKCQIQVDNFFN